MFRKQTLDLALIFRLPVNLSLLSSFTVNVTESRYPVNLLFPVTNRFSPLMQQRTRLSYGWNLNLYGHNS